MEPPSAPCVNKMSAERKASVYRLSLKEIVARSRPFRMKRGFSSSNVVSTSEAPFYLHRNEPTGKQG